MTWLRNLSIWTMRQTADCLKKPKIASTTDIARDSKTCSNVNSCVNSSFEDLILKRWTRYRFDWKYIDFAPGGRILTVLNIQRCSHFGFLSRTTHLFCHVWRPNFIFWRSPSEVCNMCWTIQLKNCQFCLLHQNHDIMRLPEKNEHCRYISIVKQTFLHNYRLDIFKQCLNLKFLPLWSRNPLKIFNSDRGIKTLTVSKFSKVPWLLMLLHNQNQNDLKALL